MNDNTGRKGTVSAAVAPHLKSRPYTYLPPEDSELLTDMSVEALEHVAAELLNAIEQNPDVESLRTSLSEVEAQLKSARALRAQAEVRHAG